MVSPHSWACLHEFSIASRHRGEDEQPDCSAETSWEAGIAGASLRGDIIICKQYSPHH